MYRKQLVQISYPLMVGIWFFNSTFNNMLVISWQSVALMEETGKNHRPVVSY